MEDELLIECVKKYKTLYDVKSKDYSEHWMKQKAWKQIGQELNISAENAKDRWTRLRRCYSNALLRRRKRTTGHTFWKFEQQMAFLLPSIDIKIKNRNKEETARREALIRQKEYKKSLINTPTIKNENEDVEENEIWLDEFEETNLYPQTEEKESEIEISIDSESSEFLNNYEKNKWENHKLKEMIDVMKNNNDELSRDERMNESTQPSIQAATHCFSPLDENDMFFLSMARMSSKLPYKEQCKIKMALSNMVLQADFLNKKMKEKKVEQEMSP